MEHTKDVLAVAENICFSYGSKAVLCGVGAEFSAGKVTSLIGPNGVGKTTLLKCLAGLLLPSTVWVKGRDMRQIKPRELARMQAYVPQNGSVLFPMTVYEFVCLGRRPYVEWSISAHDKEIVEELLQYMGIASMREKFMDELSGGERQRVMLARALVQQPDILLLDEPTSALDPVATTKIEALVQDLASKYTIVIVTHNMQQAARVSDKTAFFYMGEMVEFDNTKKIFTNPEKEATQNYITGRFG